MSSNGYQIRIETVIEVPLAVVKDEAYAGNIGPKIMAASERLYPKLKELGVTGLGKDVVIYHPGAEARWDIEPGIPIEVGVELAVPLTDAAEPVSASHTPGGRVASTLHRGPYQEMMHAHMAIHAYCGERGLKLAGPNWEVYSQHDVEDPSKLETHVYYQLA